MGIFDIFRKKPLDFSSVPGFDQAKNDYKVSLDPKAQRLSMELSDIKSDDQGLQELCGGILQDLEKLWGIEGLVGRKPQVLLLDNKGFNDFIASIRPDLKTDIEEHPRNIDSEVPAAAYINEPIVGGVNKPTIVVNKKWYSEEFQGKHLFSIKSAMAEEAGHFLQDISGGSDNKSTKEFVAALSRYYVASQAREQFKEPYRKLLEDAVHFADVKEGTKTNIDLWKDLKKIAELTNNSEEVKNTSKNIKDLEDRLAHIHYFPAASFLHKLGGMSDSQRFDILKMGEQKFEEIIGKEESDILKMKALRDEREVKAILKDLYTKYPPESAEFFEGLDKEAERIATEAGTAIADSNLKAMDEAAKVAEKQAEEELRSGESQDFVIKRASEIPNASVSAGIGYSEGLEKAGLDHDRAVETKFLTPEEVFKIDQLAAGQKEVEGFSKIASGSSRDVYVFRGGKYVVKIERGAPTQNAAESQAFEKANSDVKEMLLPIIERAPSFTWIVQPKVETADTLPLTNLYRTFNTMNESLKAKGVSIPDFNPSNIGLLNGKPVITDYGFDIKYINTNHDIIAEAARLSEKIINGQAGEADAQSFINRFRENKNISDTEWDTALDTIRDALSKQQNFVVPENVIPEKSVRSLFISDTRGTGRLPNFSKLKGIFGLKKNNTAEIRPVPETNQPAPKSHKYDYTETGSFYEGVAKDAGHVGWGRGESMQADKSTISGWSTGPNRNLRYNMQKLVNGIRLEDLVAVRIVNNDYNNTDNGRMYAYDRPTIHFTLNHFVKQHADNSWEGGNTCYIFPFKKLLELNKDRFFGGTGVDMFFVGYIVMPSPADYYLVRRYPKEDIQNFKERINEVIERMGCPVVEGGTFNWGGLEDLSYMSSPKNDSELKDALDKNTMAYYLPTDRLDDRDVASVLYFRLSYLIGQLGYHSSPHAYTYFMDLEHRTGSFLSGAYWNEEKTSLKKELEDKYGYNIEKEQELHLAYVSEYNSGKTVNINVHHVVLSLRIDELLFGKMSSVSHPLPANCNVEAFKIAMREQLNYWVEQERLEGANKKQVIHQPGEWDEPPKDKVVEVYNRSEIDASKEEEFKKYDEMKKKAISDTKGEYNKFEKEKKIEVKREENTMNSDFNQFEKQKQDDLKKALKKA